jgi:hypothetical protein
MGISRRQSQSPHPNSIWGHYLAPYVTSWEVDGARKRNGAKNYCELGLSRFFAPPRSPPLPDGRGSVRISQSRDRQGAEEHHQKSLKPESLTPSFYTLDYIIHLSAKECEMIRIFIGFVLFLFCLNVSADEVTTTTSVNPVTNETTITQVNPNTQETTTTIVTPTPAPKETVEIPQGFTSCTKIPAAWDQNIWVPEHTVCTYSNTSTTTYQGTRYEEPHWTCTQFVSSENACTKWEWVSGQWIH